MTDWIDIAEYATKYKVSQSTLRRRIRAKTIEFKMERGKYFLQDDTATLEAAPLFSRHPIKLNAQSALMAQKAANSTPRGTNEAVHDPVDSFFEYESALPVYLRSDYERLLEENKKLKCTLAEQQTLITVLESELDMTSN